MKTCGGGPPEGILLVPQKPRFRTIKWKFETSDGPKTDQLRLFFPYMLFYFFWRKTDPLNDGNGIKEKYRLHGMRVVFMKEMYDPSKEQQAIYGLSLANIESSHGVCLYEFPMAESLHDLAKASVDLFFSSPFTDYDDDYSYWLRKYDVSSGCSRLPKFLTDWEKSSSNPGWIFKKDWRKTNYYNYTNLFLKDYKLPHQVMEFPRVS